MASKHSTLFLGFDQFWQNLRIFAFRNKSMFEIGFTLLYALEQAALVWYTFNSTNIQRLSFVISIFAIVVLTTFALHKLLMESRIKLQDQYLVLMDMERNDLELQVENMKLKYDELLNFVSPKDLKKKKSSKV